MATSIHPDTCLSPASSSHALYADFGDCRARGLSQIVRVGGKRSKRSHAGKEDMLGDDGMVYDQTTQPGNNPQVIRSNCGGIDF